MKLRTKIYKHKLTILIVVALISAVAVIKFQFLPQIQFAVLSTLVLFYLCWALLYHHFDKSLKLEIMIEYILTAALALVFFYGLIL